MADVCALYNYMENARATPIDPEIQKTIDSFDNTFVKCFIAGTMTAPIAVCLHSKFPELLVSVYLFAAGAFGVFFTGFLDCVMKPKSFWRCIWESILSLGAYCLGAVLPMAVGYLFENQWFRFAGLFVATSLANSFALSYWSDHGRRKIQIPFPVLWIIIMVSTGILCFFAERAQ